MFEIFFTTKNKINDILSRSFQIVLSGFFLNRSLAFYIAVKLFVKLNA